MQPKADSRKLQLVEQLADGSLRRTPIDSALTLAAQPGVHYAVIDLATGAAPKGLVLKKHGASLVIDLQDDPRPVEITQFYEEPDTAFLPEGRLEGEQLAGTTVTTSSPEGARGAGGAGGAGGDAVVWGASPEPAGVTPMQILAGALGVGALGLAAGGGGGGGGGSAAAAPPEAAVHNTVTGTVVGGPVLPGNGLTVTIYQADGVTVLGQAKVNADGSFKVAIGAYTGVVVAKVLNTDAGVDYLDEATGQGKDLTAQLTSVDVVSRANVPLVMNINAITTIAEHAAQTAQSAAGGGVLDATVVNNANQAVAKLFGLDALQATPVVTTNGGHYDASNGLSQGEIYGAVLAALSGADMAHGGNSQQTIDTLVAGLSLTGNVAQLSESAQAIVVRGAAQAHVDTGTALSGGVAAIIDSYAPTITSARAAVAVDENLGAGRVVYTATATDASAVRWSLKASGDQAAFTIDAATGVVRLTGSPDFEAKANYAFTVVATDAAGNASEQVVTLAVNNLDEVAPTITSGATATGINENSGAGQVVYTATSTDGGDIAAGSTTYSLKNTGDAALLTVNPVTGQVTLTGNPDFEAKTGYAFTVVATDAAGNASEQAVTLGIYNLDEVAPTITSGATATAINENSGAGQVVYTATSTDSGDISNGSVSYRLKATGDAALFTVNARTGQVTLLGNPDFEAKPAYSFTVVARDTAGNASEKVVTLAVNNRDEVAPTVTSGANAPAIDENSGAGQVVYTATSTDSGDIATGSTVYSLQNTGDAALFSINAATGAVTLTANPDHEAKASYTFTVVATDAAGHASAQAVSLAVNNRDEVAPTFASGAAAMAVNENSGAGQVVYTATSTDTADIATGSTAYSLKRTGDFALFTINAASGQVTLIGNPDFEAKASYAFTVVATDAAGNASEQAVSLAINNRDEVAPTITSGSMATAVNENSGAGQVVYTANSTDSGDTATGSTVYSLKNTGDAASFTVNAVTGQVTLIGNPDFEAKASYAFTVVATDAAGNASEQAVSLAVNNRDEVAPTITSGSMATAVNENSGAGQVVYTANSTDSGDTATGSTVYSLKNTGDAASFTVNAVTGQVTLTGNPDFEAKASYAFTVVATDAAGNASEQAVSLAINNRDEVAPTITSGSTATAINENSGAGQVIYTANSTDSGDITTGSTAYSLKNTGDAASFTINAATGQVTLTGNPDFEAKASYAFTVVATDAAGNASEQAISLAINNLDEVAPTITSGATATALTENGGAGQVVYTATSTDTGDTATGSTAYSLKATGDHAAFSINASTGAVTLTANPDYETKPSYAFTVVATDAAGNASERDVTLAVNDITDETAPTISSVAISSATGIQNNALNAGDTVNVTVTMDEATVVGTTGGTPRIALVVGGSMVYATFVSGSSSTGLVFAYTVQAGDTDGNGIAIGANAIELNGGTLRDAAGNAANLAHPAVADNAGYTVDTSAPTFTSGATAAAIDENSGAGQTIYTAAATDVGAVIYSLKATGDHAAFGINGATGAVTLTADPDHETQPSYAFTVIATDAAGNASERAVTLAINDLDDVPPHVTSVAITSASGVQNGLLNAGDVVHVTATMDEATLVTTTGGTPTLALNIGGTTVQANYVSGSGSTALVFDYTVQAGQTDANGIAIGADALSANGGTLRDAAGNDAVLTHALVADNASCVVDTTAPTVSSVAITSATGIQGGKLNAGDVVHVTATMGEATLVDTTGGTPTLALNIGGTTVQANYVSGSGSTALVFDYTVQAGQTDANGIAIGANALLANGGTLHDAAGNSATLTHASVADNGSYIVDTTAPTVSSVAITSANGIQNGRLNTGDVVHVTATMGEATLVDTTGGTPTLALNIGGTTVQANYVSGSGSTALVFDYTVQAGQTDSNGIAIGANALLANGGTLQDAAGNSATLTHALVADNGSYLVDTTAPTLLSSTPADDASAVAVGNNIVLTFSETVAAGSGDIIISNGAGDTRTIAVGSSQVGISGSTVTINPTADLLASANYHVQMASGVLTDQAGNAYAGISNTTTLNFGTAAASSVNTSIVVFDLVEGVDSSHSGRTFSAAVSYTIYIRVNSTSAALSTDGTGPGPSDTWAQWTGGANLGTDDRIVLVGNGGAVIAGAGRPVAQIQNDATHAEWNGNLNSNAGYLSRNGNFGRSYGMSTFDTHTAHAQLWAGNWGANPNQGDVFANVYKTAMPVGVLTSQGLA